MKPLKRRTLLRGMVGGAAVGVGLPVLEAMCNESGTAHADGSAFPRRYIQWFWGNGVVPSLWEPTGEGRDYELSEEMAPLAPVKDVMTAFTGFDVLTSARYPHKSGRGGMLSCAGLAEGEIWQLPSLDQVLAQQLGDNTRFRSIQTAASDSGQSVSVVSPTETLPSEPSMAGLFIRLFGEGFRLPGDEVVIDPRLGLRRSVLDAVMDQQRRLSARLSSADRVRMDQHFTSVRELERRIARLEEDPPNLAACTMPEAPPASIPDDSRGRPDVAQRNEIMAELLSYALACDQTRIVSHLLSPSVNDLVFPIDGIELGGVLRGHHDLTHNEPLDDGTGQPELWRTHQIVVYIMQTLNTFVQRFRDIEEGDGSLLDNSIILATSDCSNPRLHALNNFPILTFGSLCGRLKTGHHIRSSGDNAARVNLTIARAMGLPLAEIGLEAGYVTDSVGDMET